MLLVRKHLVRAPLPPKPGHLTQSPCLDGVGNREFFKKISLQPFCSLRFQLSKWIQMVSQRRLKDQSTRSSLMVAFVFLPFQTSIGRGDWVR
jgi:hypothetical protein